MQGEPTQNQHHRQWDNGFEQPGWISAAAPIKGGQGEVAQISTKNEEPAVAPINEERG